MSLTLEIPEEAIAALRLPRDEVRGELLKELAIALYARGALSLGKAAEFSQLSRWAFEDLLGQRRVERPFTEAELDRELSSATHPFARP